MSALALAAPAGLLAPSMAARQRPAIQPLESIVSAASQRLHAEADANWRGDDAVKVEISVGRLDGRLRLPACTMPLETELPPGARPHGAVAVGVRCTAPGVVTVRAGPGDRQPAGGRDGGIPAAGRDAVRVGPGAGTARPRNAARRLPDRSRRSWSGMSLRRAGAGPHRAAARSCGSRPSWCAAASG
jgi:hypothetical protein